MTDKEKPDLPSNVVPLLRGRELDYIDYTPTDDDIHSFLRVLNYFQSMSDSLQAEVILDINSVVLSIHKESDPDDSVDEDIVFTTTDTVTTDVNLYLPLLEMVLSKKEHDIAVNDMVTKTRLAFDMLQTAIEGQKPPKS